MAGPGRGCARPGLLQSRLLAPASLHGHCFFSVASGLILPKACLPSSMAASPGRRARPAFSAAGRRHSLGMLGSGPIEGDTAPEQLSPVHWRQEGWDGHWKLGICGSGP